MSGARREKLMNLKKREELKGALRTKLRGRFGSGGAGRAADEMSVASSHIDREIAQFADSADVTEANLGRLERRIQAKALGNAPSAVSTYSVGSVGSRRSRSAASIAGESVLNNKAGAYDWARLDEYASYLHEQDALRMKMGTQALQRKLRMDLDAQVKEKNDKKRATDEEERRYHQNSMVELERWKRTEQVRNEEMKAKLMREKQDRDEQLAFERQLKDEEDRKKKDEEANLVDKIVTEMEQEQLKYEKQKARYKKKMRAVFEENQRDQEQRELQRKQQEAAEAQAMRDYNRILDEQEEQRAAELANRMGRQKELMDKLLANVEQQAKSAGDNDEMRANAQQAEMDRHYFEAESTKMSRLKQMRLENQAYLLKQMKEKDGRKDEEKMLQNIQAQILEKDTEEYQQNERQKLIDRRTQMQAHRADVEKQISMRTGNYVPDMSEAEIAMNKPLLHLVHRTLADKERHFPVGSNYTGDDEDD